MPNKIDPNSNSLGRSRRNWQRLIKGAGTSLIQVDGTTIDFNAAGALQIAPHGVGSGQLDIMTTNGDLIYYDNGATRLPIGTTGQVLTVVSGEPAWGNAASGGGVTSVGMTVPGFLAVSPSTITSTGTFAVTLATETANTVFAGPASGSVAQPAFRSLVPLDLTMTTKGDILITNATPALARLAIGSTGNVLTVSSGGLPAWQAVSGTGTVTSVGLADGTGVLSIAATGGINPITGAGTFTINFTTESANTILAGPASGSAATPTFRGIVGADLGLTTKGDLLYENATPALARLPIGSSGNVLTVVSGVPAWQAVSGTGTVTSVGLADGTGILSIAATGGVNPITGAGVFTINLATETANKFFAGPISGSAAAPTFRLITGNDLSNAVGGKGNILVGLAGSTTSGYPVGANNQVLIGLSSNSSGLAWTDVSNLLTASAYSGLAITDSAHIANIGFSVQNQDTFLAGPPGVVGLSAVPPATPSFRTLVAADVIGVVLPVYTSDPAAPTPGQAWYNSTDMQANVAYGDDGTRFVNGNIVGMFYNYSATNATVNATAATGVFSSLYSFAFPTGFLNVTGRLVRMRIYVTFNQATLNSWTFQITLSSSAGVAVLDTLTSSSAAGSVDAVLDVDLAISSGGSSGILRILGTVVSDAVAGGPSLGGLLTFNNAPFNATLQQTLQFQAKSSVANSDTCVMKYLRMELLS